MTMHKRIRLTPLDCEEIWRLYGTRQWTVVALAQQFRVSRPTISKVLERARQQEFAPRKSHNKRFLQAHYGIKRLAKVELALERRQKQAAQRYNKSYPGEMLHFDTKRLLLLTGEKRLLPPEYLFVAIDDCSRELYAAILPDKPQQSAVTFLGQVIGHARTPSKAPIPTMVRNIRARQIMPLCLAVTPPARDRSLRGSDGLKPMARRSVSLKRCWTCGMPRRSLFQERIGNGSWPDSSIFIIPSNLMQALPR